MLISVIIPSYKPQSYLYECLGALAKQTFDKAEFEVIIILNGCNEPYLSEIQQFLARSPLQTHLVQTDVPGVSNARNIGLEVARGDFIAFIDDDDLVSETYLTAMYEIAVQGYIPLANLIAFEDSQSRPISSNYITDVFNKYAGKEEITDIVSIRSFFSTSVCKLLAREVIGKKRFDVKLTNGEDCVFMFAISDKCHSFKLTPQDAIYFRRVRAHSANARAYAWSIGQRMRNAFRCIWRYSKIYFSAMGTYDFMFYATRVAGALRSIVK